MNLPENWRFSMIFLRERLGFFWNMTEEQKAAAARLYNQLFDEAVKTAVEEDYDLLVID